MDRDQAIEKIKKCLALGKSAEPHEAAAAIRQAQKLMAKFAVDGADLALADMDQCAARVPEGALVEWQARLASMVAEAFGCGYMWTRERLGWHTRTKRQIIYFGAPCQAQVAAYTFDVLLRQVIRGRAAHIQAQRRSCSQRTKTARGDRWAIGWVFGARTLVTAFACPEGHGDLLLAYSRRAWPNSTDVKPARKDVANRARPDDLLAGIKAGVAADLRRGVAGGTASPQLES